MLDRLERTLVSNPVTNALLFNPVTGAVAEYVEAARGAGRHARYRERYDVHPTFEFNGPGITLYGRGDIDLGRDSYVGEGSRLQARRGLTITVGDNTAVSHHVYLYTQNRVADQDMSRARNRNDTLAVREGDVRIGDHCWIGAFTFVTEGSTIGDDTVVGANSVVTDDLPPSVVAAGTPARVRRFKSHLDDDRMVELADEYREVLDERVERGLCADGLL